MKSKRGYKNRGSSRGIYLFFPLQQQGQVTVFIIIGIILLFSFAAILYFTSSSVRERITLEGEPVIADAPQEFASLQTFTEDCISEVAIRGIRLLGEQGGYIHPELLGDYSATNPTESVGLNLEPVKVPYWHYNPEPNEAGIVTYSSWKPALFTREDPELSIESQLGRFLDEHLPGCLQGYAAFEGQGFSVRREGIPQTEVRIGEETVNVLLTSNVAAGTAGREHAFDRFYVKIPLHLKHYYEVASGIADAQRDFNFLEKQGLELIAVYSDTNDPLSFPPTSDVTNSLFSPVSWKEDDLERRFVELLGSYVPMLRFLGSENFYYPVYSNGNRMAQKVIDNFVLPLPGAEDVSISFDYFGWKPYFDTNSDAEGTIRPEHLLVKYSILTYGQQRYETHYDASYPVLVSVEDSSALDGRGFTMNFALEANIRNNNIPVPGEEVPPPYHLGISSPACNEEHRDTAPLRLVVIDSFSHDPVELVNVGFTVPDIAECEIGRTDEHGTLEESYPAVYGGVINLLHQDYLTNFYPIDTYKHQQAPSLLGYAVAGVEELNVVEMHRFKTINVSVKKKELKKCITPLHCEYTAGTHFFAPAIPFSYKDISCEEARQQCFFNSGESLLGGDSFARGTALPAIHLEANGSISKYHDYYPASAVLDLDEAEEAIVTLERVADFHEEVQGEGLTVPIKVRGSEKAAAHLVPGIYKVTATVVRRDSLLIPAEGRCFRYDILTHEQEQCFTLEESRVENRVLGTLDWSTPETYVEITPNDLYTSNELTLYLLAEDLESVPETIRGTAAECAGFSCIGESCLFEGCHERDITISGRVIEDLQVPGMISALSQQPAIRQSLEPRFE